jgi:hypothetical protein
MHLDPSAIGHIRNILTLVSSGVQLVNYGFGHKDLLVEPLQQVKPPSTTVVTKARSWYLGSGLTEGGRNHATDR